MKDYVVEMEFSPGPVDRETLENMAVKLSDALEDVTVDVKGAAVAARFEPPTLEVDLTISASYAPSLHGSIGAVIEEIERHLGMNIAEFDYACKVRRDDGR